MSYTPTNWESDDIVSASRMNALEQAVGEMNMSYTPNVWVDGDVLTASKMNALEQAVASGGGGGSSDFSTAQVTVDTSYAPSQVYFSFILIVVDDEYGATQIDGQDGNEVNTYNAILYKGECLFSVEGYNIEIAGNAETDEFGIKITGDCTLTFKAMN